VTAVTKISALELKEHSCSSFTIDKTSWAPSPGHVLGPTIFLVYLGQLKGNQLLWCAVVVKKGPLISTPFLLVCR